MANTVEKTNAFTSGTAENTSHTERFDRGKKTEAPGKSKSFEAVDCHNSDTPG